MSADNNNNNHDECTICNDNRYPIYVYTECGHEACRDCCERAHDMIISSRSLNDDDENDRRPECSGN